MTEKTYFVLVGKRLDRKVIDVPKKNVSKIVEDYPNKVLAEITASQHQELLKLGYKVENLSFRTKIRIGKYAIDPIIPEERKKAVGSAEEEEKLKTEHFFIQFIGPTKAKWLNEVKNANIILLSYYNDFTYFVYGKPSDVNKIARKSFVRGILPYGPRLKLSPETQSVLKRKDVEDKLQEFWILVFSEIGSVKKTMAFLKRLGVEIIDKGELQGYYHKFHVRISINTIYEVVSIPEVYFIEPFYPAVDEDEVADMIIATGNIPLAPGTGVNPYLDWLNDMGIDGTGVTIGIVEANNRFDENHPAFTGRVNTLTTQARGNHATMVAGQAAGDYRTDLDPNGFIFGIGIAPRANLLNQYYYDGTNDQTCRQTVTNAGTVQNNSWGAGNFDPMDYQNMEQAFDRFVRNSDNTAPGNHPLILCFSAGNSGNAGLTRPKGAKNIITTGNFENFRTGLFGCGDLDADNINERYIRGCGDSGTDASSIGNCGDGRVKPDIVAAGQWTASPSFNVTAANWPERFINNLLAYGGGTSAASPKIAGACALITQWWRQRHRVDAIENTPSPALAKAMLINGAVDTGEGGPIPNEEQGWGRVNLNNVFNPEVPAIYVDQDILLQPGSPDIEFDIEPIDTTQPMKVTLVWTDVPGPLNSGTAVTPALINVLGLEITQGLNTWFGNNFAGGFSQTGGVQDAIQNVHPGDIVNNVQNVFIQNPLGDYHIRITPENIVGDCLNPEDPYINPLNLQQDFALVIQNAKLKTTEPLDVMLTIDRTGSMSGSRIAAVIASGQEFFDLIPIGFNHRAGLISYAVPCNLPHDTDINNKVTVDVDMDMVTNTLKTNAQGIIGGITASGCTSIGAGLTKAIQRIVANGQPLHRKVIALLSDGKENRSPYVNEILPLLRKEYRVHAVGLGGSINASLMQQIADETHGTFLHTLDPDDITPLYREIFALENNEEVVGHEDGVFAEEETGTQIKRFSIINSDIQATFVVGWKDPAVSLNVELVTPRGETISPTHMRRSSMGSFIKRDTHVIYTIKKPLNSDPDWEGEWAVKICRPNGSTKVAGTYTVSVLVHSSLRLKVSWDKAKYSTNDLPQIKVHVIDEQYALKNHIKMAIRTTTPLKGYGSILAEMAKKVSSYHPEDAIGEPLETFDRYSDEEWQKHYTENKEYVKTTFKVGRGDASKWFSTEKFITPHIAKLKKIFRPIKDGIYTYRIQIEGFTESGARFTRVRTISKFIEAKVDANQSKVILQPVSSKKTMLQRLTFIPKDSHGNLIGPNRANNIKVDVDKGEFEGEIKDLLDGSYSVEFKTLHPLEKMAITVTMDDVSIPILISGISKSGVTSIPAPTAKQVGKVEQLRFDGKGNFLGFTLGSLSGSIDFPPVSRRLVDMLVESMEKGLRVVVLQDESTGDVTELKIETS